MIWQLLCCRGSLRSVAFRAACPTRNVGTRHETQRIGAHTTYVVIHIYDISDIYDISAISDIDDISAISDMYDS